jgi:hypothetical protein
LRAKGKEAHKNRNNAYGEEYAEISKIVKRSSTMRIIQVEDAMHLIDYDEQTLSLYKITDFIEINCAAIPVCGNFIREDGFTNGYPIKLPDGKVVDDGIEYASLEQWLDKRHGRSLKDACPSMFEEGSIQISSEICVQYQLAEDSDDQVESLVA